MRNTFTISKVLSKHALIFWGVKKLKKTTHIVFSNGAPTHNYVPGTFNFHECGGKIDTEGSVSQFFECVLCSNFITISFRIWLKMRKNDFSNFRFHNF